MELLLVSLGRTTKTMISSTNVGVGFPSTVVGRHAVNVDAFPAGAAILASESKPPLKASPTAVRARRAF